MQQAGMGGVSTAALAGAVAGEGALGMIAATGLTAEGVCEQLDAASTVAGPGAVVGANFLMPFLDRSVFLAAARHASVVECFYGDPDSGLVADAHDAGALVAWQVGSVDEAVAAEDAGCDLVVAQGFEAGGHVRGRTPLLELLGAVRSVIDVPLVAAGGIGSGVAFARALEAGADAVRVGTVLLAAAEADVHPGYVAALVAASADDTVVTETFVMGWPQAPHRVLRSCIEASDADPVVRSPLPPGRSFTGDVAAAALYAGTSVEHVHGVETASEIIRRLVADADAALAGKEHGLPPA